MCVDIRLIHMFILCLQRYFIHTYTHTHTHTYIHTYTHMHTPNYFSSLLNTTQQTHESCFNRDRTGITLPVTPKLHITISRRHVFITVISHVSHSLPWKRDNCSPYRYQVL